MSTGSNARDYGKQLVHYLRKGFTYADNGSVLRVGELPAGALILKPLSGVFVNEAFNAGTSNVLDIGTDANDDLYGTDLALGSIAFVPIDEAVSMVVSSATKITATPALSGTAATAGQGEIVIAYMPDNDG